MSETPALSRPPLLSKSVNADYADCTDGTDWKQGRVRLLAAHT